MDAFLKEAALLQRLSGCPHVVHLHGACVVDQSLAVVMELLEVRREGVCECGWMDGRVARLQGLRMPGSWCGRAAPAQTGMAC